MALTPEQNDALIREVDDAVRQDDFNSFWKRYGRLIAAVIGIGLASYGGWLLWQNQRHSAAERHSEDFAVMVKAASGARLDEANYEKLVKSGGEGYAAEAELMKAALEAGKGDLKAATASFDALIADADTPEPLRNLAIIRKTALNFDTTSPETVIGALKPMAVPGNPWFGSAGEMTAIAYLKMNKKKEAGDMFASISRDTSVPESVRQRAGQMASSLGADPDATTLVQGQ